MITIRHYTKADWQMIEDWWKASGEIAPLPSMMPLESSFVAEINNEPALAVAVYLTNTPALAYVENFIGNPKTKGEERKQASHVLAAHLCSFAKARGYQRLLCMTEKPILMAHYHKLGFTPTLGGVTTFVRNT